MKHKIFLIYLSLSISNFFFLFSWIKELSIRSSIPQVRRQLFLNLSSNLSNNTYSNDIFPKPQTKHNTLPKRPQWMTSLFGRGSQRHTLSL